MSNIVSRIVNKGGVSPSLFCAIPSFGFGGPFPQTITVVQSVGTDKVTMTAGGSGGTGGSISNVASKSTTGNLSMEGNFISNTGGVGIFGIAFTQAEMPGASTAGIVLFLSGGSGTLFDLVGSAPIGAAFTVSYPLDFSVNLDQAAGTATFEFADGVNDTSGSITVEAGYDNSQFIFGSVVSIGMGANEVIEVDINVGSSAFTLPNSSGKYCDYTNQAFCNFQDVSIFGGGGTVNVETGFIECIGSLASRFVVEKIPVSSTSKTAKSEILFFSDLNATVNETLELSFVDADAQFPNVFCGLVINPITGTVVDLNGGTVETSVTMVAGTYKIWVDFDLGAGTATYTDTLGNTGSLVVSGYTVGNNVFYAYRPAADTAANSELVMGYNSGEKEFSNALGLGYCQI